MSDAENFSFPMGMSTRIDPLPLAQGGVFERLERVSQLMREGATTGTRFKLLFRLGEFPVSIGFDKHLMVGREAPSQLAIPDARLSGRHFILQEDEERDSVMIQDLNSKNGTMVNGKRIESTWLHSGDLITCGSLEFAFIEEQERSSEIEAGGSKSEGKEI